jgi:hypothetical protein
MDFIYWERMNEEAVLKVHGTTRMSLCLSEAVEFFSSYVPC